MPLVRSALIATAACLIGAVAYAQPATTDQASPPPADQSAAPPAASADMNAAPPANASPAPDAMPSAGASTAAPTGAAANTSATVDANGTQVIASQPVPDTPANRAAFGKPMSHAGKRTAPSGD